MDPVDEFLERYLKEYDYYDEVGRTAARRIEASLEAAGLRAIVTSRAKSPTRLLEKLRKRQPEKLYGSVPEIYSDIVDLAGVRVALYFPGDRDRVDLLIRKDFAQDGAPRVSQGTPMTPVSGSRDMPQHIIALDCTLGVLIKNKKDTHWQKSRYKSLQC